MHSNLFNKIILVVGSTKGLGAHVAKALEKDGAMVIRHRRAGKSVSGFVTFDIVDPSAVALAMIKVVRRFRKIDAVINCVGPFHPKRIDQISTKDWKTDLETTVNGTFCLTRAVLPIMRRQKLGRIIYIGDSMADRFTATPFSISYKIAKNGLVTMARAFAQTEAKNGITVNVVSPGIMPNSTTRPSKGVAETPFEEVYKAIRFLLSDDAGHITGTNLVVSGGFFGL